MKSYRSVHDYGENEFITEKSRFISYACPVENEEEATRFIEKIKNQHKMATHNCYAYIIDDNLKRFSDDGEPSHTAGMPILDTLSKEGLEKICLVVTRYFGGTLLGKGGLVRAYTQGAKLALNKAKIVDKIYHYKLSISLDYSLLGILENYLRINKIDIIDKSYLEKVDLFIYIAQEKFERLIKEINDLLSSNYLYKIEDELFLSVENGKIIK